MSHLQTYSHSLFESNSEISSYTYPSAPLTIKRKGAVGWHEFDVVDDLTIHYAHGRPVRVDDSAPEVLYEPSMDFNDLADEEIEMDYDRCGRLTMDLNRGITRIAYNAIGMPMAAFKDGKKILSMEYSADGTLLSRTEYPLQITPERPDPFPFPGLSDDAAGADATAIDFVRPELGWYRPVTYRRICTQSWINTRLNRVESEYGYILGDTLSAYYRDFQGNICAVVRNNQPIQATSYYPYGLPMAESSNADVNRLKYSGKELVTHRGYDAYDFGPRNHLPTLCLFDNPDLLQEKFYGLHPSNYCTANPINYIDPDGKKVIFVHGMLAKFQLLPIIEWKISISWLGPTEGGKTYWNSSFIKGANKFFKDNDSYFVNYDHSPIDYRMVTGYIYMLKNIMTKLLVEWM